MTQSDQSTNTPPSGEDEVSATWLKEQFGSFGTKLQGLETQFAGLLERLPKPEAESQSPQNPQTNPQQPPSQPQPENQATVRQPAESTQTRSGARSVLRIGTGLRVRK